MTRKQTPEMFGTDTILGADHSIAVGALTMANGIQDDVRMIFGAGEQPPPGVQQVPLDDIADNPFQPRQSYDPAGLEELATSIESEGLLQAPAGRRLADGRVQLIFGHRRRRAFDLLRAKDAGRWSSMPVLLVEASDEDMAARAWAENVERQDLTAVEQAQAMQRMMESFGWTQADVARRLGLAPATVANKLRLLRAPVEVQEAVRDRLMSERQAGALAPVWELPAPALEAARNRQGYGGVPAMIDAARRGLSSDDLRRQAKEVIETQSQPLRDKAWADVDLGGVARVVASRCTMCQYRILSGGEARCAGQRTCYEAKGHAWRDPKRAELALATGLPALPSATNYSDYEAFYGEKRTIAEQAGLQRAPFCERLRVKERDGGYAASLQVEGHEGVELVCLHSGRGCECLARLTRDLAKDGKAQWKMIRQQTVEALTEALLHPTEDTMRLWAAYHAPYEQTDQVVSWRMEDVAKTIVKALMDRAKPYDAEKKPEESRAAMEKLLRRGNIAAPWTLAAVLAPEPDPTQRMRGRVQMLVTWITSATSETPLAADLERWIDDSRAAMDELAGLPAGMERDELAAQADAVNQSALEMLDLVAAGYQVSKDVSWICHTPVSDVNARASLERATVDDLRWFLAVARCQGENKGRLEAIRGRLKRARSETGRSGASVGGAEPRATGVGGSIVTGLQRIIGWMAEYMDPGDGLPIPESVAERFDEMDGLAQRIAALPNEGDRAKLQAMHAQVYADLAALSDRVQASYDEEMNHA